MENILSPSMLAIDFANIEKNLKIIEDAGAKWLHIDVMDGMFVPNISIGPCVIGSIRKVTGMFFDVHLMIEEPGRYIEEFKNAGADMMTVHVETCRHLHSTITDIKKAGMKVGVALNPATPVSALECIIKDVDMVLVMSVNPGFGGQKFIDGTLDKIRETRELMYRKGVSARIQVDGGVTLSNVNEVLEAGADVIVAGSAVFKGNPAENVKAFLERLGE